MKAMKIKRFVITAVILIAAYLLQCTVFSSLELAGIKPNLLIIVTSSFGFMRDSREGMLWRHDRLLRYDLSFCRLYQRIV